ncbi:MAG: Hsp33 family molecular chaperone HslO [Desulfamplus sp.]|nr:Hsp33 family molecular chaperone HslO [Desulfamplus sp.]
MIKKDIYKGKLKEQLKASSKDRLYRFMLSDGMLRGAIVNSTNMVNEMSANHNLGYIETLLLGQAYIASSLLTTNLKGNDRISISIDCSGHLKGIDVESNAFGEVRGYLKNPNFSDTFSDKKDSFSDKKISLSSLFGAGFLTVNKYLEDAKSPYSGKIMLEYGTIAEDLANYFLKSEQTPTAFNLSVNFDDKINIQSNYSDIQGQLKPDSKKEQYLDSHLMVDGAGGLFLQAMPGADSNIVEQAEDIMRNIKSLGATFAKGISPDILILEKFNNMSPLLLGNYRVEFFCRCSLKIIRNYISRLPKDELIDISRNGPFPLEVRCHQCNTFYNFTQTDIEEIILLNK